MPDVEMPNGDIVNFPDDMHPEQIRGLIASKFPEVTPVEPPPQTIADKAGSVWEGVKQGTTLGFGDELQAAIAAGVASPFVDQSYGELYSQGLENLRGELAQAREVNPYLTGAGEIGGALLTGGAAAGRVLPQGAKAYAATRPIKAAGAIGALEGGLYGYGTGEGGAAQRS